MNNSIEFWKQFIKSNLEHNLDFLVKNSIKDFHFKGLNYICFQFLPHLTIRLYIIEPQEQLDTKNVNIHNHLYDSQILVLTNTLVNNVYKQVPGDEYNHYYLTSALAVGNASGKIKLDSLGKTGLELVRSITLNPGNTHFQDSEEIHNVENDVTKLTAFMVFEYPTVKDNSILFTTKDYTDTIPTPNAYNKYTHYEITRLLTNLLNVL